MDVVALLPDICNYVTCELVERWCAVLQGSQCHYWSVCWDHFTRRLNSEVHTGETDPATPQQLLVAMSCWFGCTKRLTHRSTEHDAPSWW